VKERPILFSGPMVSAILAGKKTQTRRVVKPQPFLNQAGFLAWKTSGCLQNMGRTAEEMLAKHCPHGQPGDSLWVREMWRVGAWSNRQEIAVDYLADHSYRQEWLKCDDESLFDRLVDQSIIDAHKSGHAENDGILAWTPGNSPCRRRPSIHMPKWASRIRLDIVDVSVERLNDISGDDAQAEGIERVGGTYSCSPWRNYRKGEKGEMNLHCSARERSYMTLWESINGPGSWNVNPYVWVIKFMRAV
jgi:hypothetical protein